MPKNETLIQEIGRELWGAERILVVSHIRPDGDAVGSLLGLGLSLQEAGKKVQMVLSDGVPSNFRHLEGSQKVLRKSDGRFDLTCVLDCSDINRTGESLNNYLPPDINLDHHITNLNFARLNLVEPEAVATTEILARILPRLNFPITTAVAAALLTGLITDTLGFRTANITPDALRTAARLMETGANLSDLYHRALLERSFEATHFWGTGLVKLEREGGIVWATLTLADRKAVGYSGKDDADLINVLSSINSADIALIFVEQPKGRVKVSWRAKPGFDVSGIAFDFGGGGHPSASGAEIEGDLDQVCPVVLQATRVLLNGDVISQTGDRLVSGKAG